MPALVCGDGREYPGPASLRQFNGKRSSGRAAQTVWGASAMLVGMKFFVWFLFGVLVYLAWRTHRRRRAANAMRSVRHAERMVRCERCGVHLPVGEAVERRGVYYCGDKHADAGNDGGRA